MSETTQNKSPQSDEAGRTMDAMHRRYVIWSIEHQAWWKASRHGYAPTLAEAGRFTEKAAAAIVADANRVKTEEFMIPAEALAGSAG